MIPLSSGSMRRGGYTRMPSLSQLPNESISNEAHNHPGYATGDITDSIQHSSHDALGISSATDTSYDMTSAVVTSPPLMPDFSSEATTPRQSMSNPGTKRLSQMSPAASHISSLFTPSTDISLHTPSSLDSFGKPLDPYSSHYYHSEESCFILPYRQCS